MSEKIYKTLFINDSEEENFLTELLIDEDNIPIQADFIIDGSMAEDYLDQLKPEELPDFIFLDINMPLMDGFQFMEIYSKKYCSMSQRTKLYFLSSSIRASDKERVEAMECAAGYLTKPFTAEMFQSLIEDEK